MPLTDTEKRRIYNSLTLESLRIEHVRISREIQSQGFSMGRTDALLAQLNKITEARRQQLVSNQYNSSEKPNNKTIANEQHVTIQREQRHFSKQDFRRFDELILHESEAVALQIYHPTTSELHSDADRRILRLKDGGNPEIHLYAEAVTQVLPRNHLIYLVAVPPSSPHGGQSLKWLIREISNRSDFYKDRSSILGTTEIRGKKSHGYRFTDEELAQTIAVEQQHIANNGAIILLDDVVTSGQSFRVCEAKLREAGITNDILYLAMAKTDRYSQQTGIADTLYRQQSTSTTSAHTPRTTHQSRPPSPDTAHRREQAGQNNSRRSNSQLVQNTRYTQNSQRQSTNSSKDDCFVITAIYEGNYEHPNVQTLRRWRDEKLIKSVGGRTIVAIYYNFGPSLARAVKSLRLTKPLRLMLEAIMRDHQQP